MLVAITSVDDVALVTSDSIYTSKPSHCQVGEVVMKIVDYNILKCGLSMFRNIITIIVWNCIQVAALTTYIIYAAGI